MKVSIITPCYNSSRFIKETIESVIAQTYQDWEMIIVDDCSKDNSVEIISDYSQKDERIKLIQLTENIGAAKVRNVALKAATGRYIAFLDSDDVWHPDKLEKQIKFMVENDIAFSITSYQQIDSHGKLHKRIIKAPKIVKYHKYIGNTIIGCLTVVIDKNKTGYFEMPNIRSSHDMALWLKLMKSGFNAYGIKESLAYYRISPNSNTANKYKAAKDVWKVQRHIEKLNLLKSFYYFSSYAFNAIRKRI